MKNATVAKVAALLAACGAFSVLPCPTGSSAGAYWRQLGLGLVFPDRSKN